MLKNFSAKNGARYLILISCFLLCIRSVSAVEENLEFSGFARVVAGYTNANDNTYNGYDDNVRFNSESLLGLRFDYKVNDKINLVTQGVAYANNMRDSRIQWLYANYRPSNNLTFKIGRQRAPIFELSEIVDVGFAYPWISLPESVYFPFLFNEFDGVLATYEFSLEGAISSIDLYSGGLDNTISPFGDVIRINVDNFKGIIARFAIDEFSFRASIHKAHANVIADQIIPFRTALLQLGFEDSANALIINDTTRYKQFSVLWENLDYFARFEYTAFDSNSFQAPDNKGFYLTLGYNFYPFTTHITYAKSSVDQPSPPNEIPTGINPELDVLAFQYQLATGTTDRQEINNVSVGIRYDYSINLAFKTALTFLKSDDTNILQPPNSQFYIAEDAELFQIAMEWVF